MSQNWRPKLAIHTLWHPSFEQGPSIAEYLYSTLCRDVSKPNSRGIGIPVFFRAWEAPTPSGLLEATQRGGAELTVVLPLVDDYMTGSDEWQQALEGLRGREALSLIPVALSPYSFNISPTLGRLNFLRLANETPGDRPQRLVSRLTHELCRILINGGSRGGAQVGEGPAPVRLFLSHAKQDGLPIVNELLEYLVKNSPVQAFFDTTSITAGEDFERIIEEGVRNSAMLIAHSDFYSSREWCRREVLLAKKHQCPIVVAIAVDKEEDRSFPYLGNVPTIRWDPTNPRRCADVIDRALREILRSCYFGAHLKTLQDAGQVPAEYQVLTRPPEILTYLNLARVGPAAQEWSPVIYPDPPLGDEEVQLIHAAAPGALLTTPSSSSSAQWMKSSDQKAPLHGMAIALSISESADLPFLGMGPQHLDDAFQEFARHMLANGATIVYGGDLRISGFTRILIDLVQSYRMAGQTAWKKVRSFISWPIHLKQEPAEWAALKARYRPDCDFRPVAKPLDVQTSEKGFFPPDTPERRYAWARGLTAMREAMEAQADLRARVLLGGKLQDYRGRYPGVVEEALLAIQGGKPVFVCGGFGGAAGALAQALQGDCQELSLAFQTKDPAYASLVEQYNQPGREPIDYRALGNFFRDKGPAGLNNGLSDEDNLTLFRTPHITEIIYLVLKGLANLPPAAAPSGTPPS